MTISLSELFRLCFDSCPFHVVLSDGTGTVVYSNDRSGLMSFRPGDNIFGVLDRFFRSSGLSDEGGSLFVRSMRIKPYDSIFFLKEKGSFLSFSGRPLALGDRVFGYLVTVRDVTDRFLGERMLRRMERIDSIVGTLSVFFTELSRSLGFLMDRTQAVLRSGDLGGDQVKMVEDMAKALLDVKSMMESFVHFVEMEGEDETVSLRETVESCAKGFAKDMERLGIKFSLEDRSRFGMFIRTNPLRLREVFRNLFSNSICSLSGWTGKREIHVVIEDRGKEAFVVFEDTGPGIPKEQLDRVFDPRFSTARGQRGFDLYVAAFMVSRMGGRIDVLSEEGRFTRFILVLPKGFVGGGCAGTDVISGKRFLVCDEGSFFRRVVSGFLRKRGAEEVIELDRPPSLPESMERFDVFIFSDKALRGLTEELVSAMKGKLLLLVGEGPSAEGVPCLKKPFSLYELEGALLNILGGVT